MSSPLAARPHRAGPRLSRLTIHLSLLNRFSVLGVAWTAIAFVSFLHLAALTLFTRGFLLSRTTLENRNICDVASTDCTLPARYDRTVILLIDALRYDFIFPKSPRSESYNPTHHNRFTLPAQLTASQPRNSLLFKGVADPPTATLQRLKAITTGSLPTFVDVGSNFAGSAVTEDSWIEQASRIGKRVAFVGDDTWLTIFPESAFAPNLTFPFDSFNVEDLDTVDNGVRYHVLPLLEQPPLQTSWDILIAHPLGLDHAGHRFGAGHSETTRKLVEMNDLVVNIVERLGKKDLLIVLGDHGMDAKGDHGGDSPDETDAALWFYSKTPLTITDPLRYHPIEGSELTLQQLLEAAPDNGAVGEFFRHDGDLQRSVSQISIVPTLSLLMGLAIPFNNLAAIIPELFLTPSDERGPKKFWQRDTHTRSTSSALFTAMQINADQIKNYIVAYTAHPSGKDLLPARQHLLDLYESGRLNHGDAAVRAIQQFTYATLKSTRQIWARFDPVLMGAGLLILVGSLMVAWRLYSLCHSEGCLFRQRTIRQALSVGTCASLIGLLMGTTGWLLALGSGARMHIANVLLFVGAAAAISSFLVASLEFDYTPFMHRGPFKIDTYVAVTIMLVHTTMFAANSYTMWEDRIVSFLVQIPPLFILIASFSYKSDRRQRRRIQLFSLASILVGRLNAFSTICREEQHPYCTATFYGRNGVSSSTLWLLVCAFIAAIVLPSALRRFLDIARACQGWSTTTLLYCYRLLLMAASLYWIVDHFEDSASRERRGLLIALKTTLARTSLMCALALGSFVWALSPLCIAVEERQIIDHKGEAGTQITVIGFANTFGSYYLLFTLAPFAIMFLLSPPMGQIVLTLTLLSSLAYFEGNDRLNDIALGPQEVGSTASVAPPLNMLGTVFFVLLGMQAFFSTGHQAVLASIQWKSAFIGFKTLTYPFSPLLVLLNTLGPILLSACILPLLAFWKRSPTLKGGPSSPVVRDLLRACLGFLIYHSLITLTTAAFAAHLRRHLMVWKVFAPRFMLSAICLLSVDAFFLLLIIPWGIRRTLIRVQQTFGTAFS